MSIAAPVLVVGAGGMLGRAVSAALWRRGVTCHAPDRRELDLSRPERIAECFPEQVGTVINCAAYTNVDAAEENEAEATVVNGEAVGALGEACRLRGATLVHFSTDYVFDGLATTPYAVDHPRAPLNAYGRSKAAGEIALTQCGASYLMVRTSWVYAPWGKNFVLTMLGLAKSRPNLRVVSDQVGCPSSAEGIAKTTLALLDGDARGIFHVTDAGQCSWFELASFAIGEAGIECEVAPCTSEEFVRPATRPAYSVLDSSRTVERVGALLPWRDAVRGVVSRVERKTG